ncbi:unnamed protein product [Ectocarpus sp. 6 AP-2014]
MEGGRRFVQFCVCVTWSRFFKFGVCDRAVIACEKMGLICTGSVWILLGVCCCTETRFRVVSQTHTLIIPRDKKTRTHNETFPALPQKCNLGGKEDCTCFILAMIVYASCKHVNIMLLCQPELWSQWNKPDQYANVFYVFNTRIPHTPPVTIDEDERGMQVQSRAQTHNRMIPKELVYLNEPARVERYVVRHTGRSTCSRMEQQQKQGVDLLTPTKHKTSTHVLVKAPLCVCVSGTIDPRIPCQTQ